MEIESSGWTSAPSGDGDRDVEGVRVFLIKPAVVRRRRRF